MTDPSTDEHTLLGLLADIRAAAGDREGRLMQAELVEHIRGLKARADQAEQLAARVAELEQYEDMVILRCGELETFDEYRAAMQRDDSDRLRAEVEALRADAGRWREVRRGQTLSVVDWVGVHLRAESADTAVDAAIAARKGEGSEG